jgi:hypothetical protein
MPTYLSRIASGRHTPHDVAKRANIDASFSWTFVSVLTINQPTWGDAAPTTLLTHTDFALSLWGTPIVSVSDSYHINLSETSRCSQCIWASARESHSITWVSNHHHQQQQLLRQVSRECHELDLRLLTTLLGWPSCWDEVTPHPVLFLWYADVPLHSFRVLYVGTTPVRQSQGKDVVDRAAARITKARPPEVKVIFEVRFPVPI